MSKTIIKVKDLADLERSVIEDYDNEELDLQNVMYDVTAIGPEMLDNALIAIDIIDLDYTESIKEAIDEWIIYTQEQYDNFIAPYAYQVLGVELGIMDEEDYDYISAECDPVVALVHETLDATQLETKEDELTFIFSDAFVALVNRIKGSGKQAWADEFIEDIRKRALEILV